jgi:hypothetical protein
MCGWVVLLWLAAVGGWWGAASGSIGAGVIVAGLADGV